MSEKQPPFADDEKLEFDIHHLDTRKSAFRGRSLTKRHNQRLTQASNLTKDQVGGLNIDSIIFICLNGDED
ncbi:MAG TPA: hypothetical protein VF209_00325 [Patescibacteria group bacterium]